MAIGEAAVTVLDDHGVPTPLVHSKLPGPRSRMDPADDVDGTAKASPLFAKYGTRIDNESAREVLAGRLAAATAAAAPAPAAAEPATAPAPAPKPPAPSGGGLGDFLNSRQGKQLQKEVVRGVFGLLKKSF